MSIRLAIASLAIMLAGGAIASGGAAAATSSSATAYTVLGVNGASCTLGIKWLPRLTSHRGSLTKGPTGWQCIVISVVWECTIKGGGIFEWLPKLKK